MEIRSLSATFGRLENKTLTLSPGLNVVEAGNESGKTTWMALLRVMLYGLNTRDRGPTADKHRYMPWSGSPMQGQLDLACHGDSITITRSTARANAPMGAFTAQYTGTATAVPELTAATCGETLLGVPADVFERSAFIRQSGISIDHSASLERRIAALITTGEEESSYTDAADRLRKQLNRRRYNKTGLLPQLENEVRALEAAVSEISALENTKRAHEDERDTLLVKEDYLRRQLALCDAADNAQRAQQFRAAKDDLAAAAAERDAAARVAASLPSRSELSFLIGDLSAAERMGESARAAASRTREAAADLQTAQQRLAAHPFAPKTPDEAAGLFAADTPRPRFPLASALLSALFLALAPILHLALSLPLPLSSAAAVSAAACWLLALGLRTAKRQRRWEADETARRSAHSAEVEAYSALYYNVEQHKAALAAAEDAHRALSLDHNAHLERVLFRVRAFGSAENAAEAVRAIESALARHTALDEADRHHHQAQLRFDLMAENAPEDTTPPAAPPALSRTEAQAQLQTVTARLGELQRSIHTVSGRSQALGDPLLMQADLAEKRRRIETLQKEYDAIALASAVLADANTSLQNRFSPALGEKSANIFTKLTRGKYNKVLLDRDLNPSAQEDGSMLARSVPSLSQGAADQLYLAVRLAICDLVLPEENGVPIFLDDALVTFDDERMAAALDYLAELSEHRQIVLFTCQQRELNYLRTTHPGRYSAVKLS